MAGLFLHVNSGEVTLVAATPKTVLQVRAPAQQRLVVKGVRLFGKMPAGGTDPAVKVRFTRNSANFGTGTAATPAKNDPSDTETIQSTAASNFTVEPTTPTDAGIWYDFNPQTGIIEGLPPGLEWKVPGGQSLQIEMTSTGTPVVVAVLDYEE